MNKSDLLEKNPQLDEPNIFLLSAKTGKGVDRLLDHIADQFIDADSAESSITARERHLRVNWRCLHCILQSRKGIVENEALDLVAEELLQAQNSLAEVTGEFTTEDLLGEIFKSFCIGK